MQRRLLAAALAAALAGTTGTTGIAWAQQPYPTKPVRVVVPYPPGGGTDLVARTVFLKVAEALGQPVVVENKAGAGTAIGLAEVARAAPDGYTLAVGGTSDPLLPLLYDNLSFNPLTDLVFVSTLASVPLALVASNGVTAKGMADFTAQARAQSARPMAIASVGVTSPHHMAAILLAQRIAAPLEVVAYKGTTPAVTDIVGGHIPLGMMGLPSVLPHAQAGKLKILGVGSAQRSVLAPDIPTIAEQGVADFEATYWYHVTAPKGTPKSILDRLHAEIDRAVRSTDVRATLIKGGFEPLTLTAEESDRALKADTARWTKVIRDNKIRGE